MDKYTTVFKNMFEEITKFKQHSEVLNWIFDSAIATESVSYIFHILNKDFDLWQEIATIISYQ